MHLGKRTFKVLDQLGEASLYRALPRDQDIIIAFERVTGPCHPYCFLESPPRPVADDRPAESFRGGEAEAGNVSILRLGVYALARLKHERRGGEASATPYMQELCACLETSDLRHRLGSAGLCR